MAEFAEFKEITNEQDFAGIMDESSRRKVIIFKHSTACPTSAFAWGEVQELIRNCALKILVVMIKVIESRPLSNYVAAKLEVKHQSPQVILINNKKVLWHASHQVITEENINRALAGESQHFNMV